jgi:hypothetical protein
MAASPSSVRKSVRKDGLERKNSTNLVRSPFSIAWTTLACPRRAKTFVAIVGTEARAFSDNCGLGCKGMKNEKENGKTTEKKKTSESVQALLGPTLGDRFRLISILAVSLVKHSVGFRFWGPARETFPMCC